MRLCFVVHRYAPYPGGTETYARALAEECLRRGHEVWILSRLHRGDLNGVKVTSDISILSSPFDLVVVHGKFALMQKYVLNHCDRVNGPVLYLLIAHGERSIVKKGLENCALAGWSTPDDLAILRARKALEKSCRVRHGLPLESSLGKPGFRAKYGISPQTRMFLSCGGYWPHKRMKQLAALFMKADIDALLVTTGYQKKMFCMPKRSEKVLPLLVDDREDVLSAMLEADCYIMHSQNEGFGLVLLEVMLNRTPWIAHRVGGAKELHKYGATYSTDKELLGLIRSFARSEEQVLEAEAFVRSQYLVEHAVDDIEAAARRSARPGSS